MSLGQIMCPGQIRRYFPAGSRARLRAVFLASLLCAPCFSSLSAKNLIKVEVEGKTYIVDTDSSDVQKNLKAANPQAGEVKLPAWLFPSPGQAPLRSNYDVRTGISSATFASGGTVDQVVAYYGQLLASKGFPGGGPLGHPNSKIISGKNVSATISVTVNTPFRNPNGGTEIMITHAPSAAASGVKHFEAAWFDPARAVLCLRDPVTGEEYLLDARAIVEANLNRPGAVKSEGASMPAWLPIYPGARRTTVEVIWAYDPTATFQTRDSIRAVYDYYLAALPKAGATVVSNRMVRSGTPSRDFSARIVAQLGDDVVDVRAGEIVNLNPLAAALNNQKPLQGTGIGVRYTVPQR